MHGLIMSNALSFALKSSYITYVIEYFDTANLKVPAKPNDAF